MQTLFMRTEILTALRAHDCVHIFTAAYSDWPLAHELQECLTNDAIHSSEIHYNSDDKCVTGPVTRSRGPPS
jgi:hypothetical protein